MSTPPNLVFLLGGHDLEMVTIRALVSDTLGPLHLIDKHLAWGARASAYETDIGAALGNGQTPVLLELIDDLPPAIPRPALIDIDHHGARAGADQPCSLRQVFDLLALPQAAWCRQFDLVAVNDIGHMAGMRAFGASAEEIRGIRDADRSAQGVTSQDELAARDAMRQMERHGRLLVAHLTSSRTSPLLDFLEPEYGGHASPQDVLVITPTTVEFYGRGSDVLALAATYPQSWSGGALPGRGFWGIAEQDVSRRDALVAAIIARLRG